MIHIRKFHESPYTSFENGEVYANPSLEELDNLAIRSYKLTKEFSSRFLANLKEKIVYVWSHDVQHSDMAEHLGLKFIFGGSKNIFAGYVSKEDLTDKKWTVTTFGAPHTLK